MEKLILTIFAGLVLLSCDPAHTGYFENGTGEEIVLEIPNYPFDPSKGVLIGPYPQKKGLDIDEYIIDFEEVNDESKLTVRLDDKHSILISYSLGFGPAPGRDLDYSVFMETDTIKISEVEVFKKLKKRDRNRFNYYYTFNE